MIPGCARMREAIEDHRDIPIPRSAQAIVPNLSHARYGCAVGCRSMSTVNTCSVGKFVHLGVISVCYGMFWKLIHPSNQPGEFSNNKFNMCKAKK